MNQRLLTRLDAIAQAVQGCEDGLALLGLGSVGQDLQRLDAYSDLDFFVIVRPGSKWRFLDSLDWLESVQPIAYSFQNTVDGFKLLYDDGIFCEMAVFEPQELANIPYDGARVVWQDESSDLSLPISNKLPPAPAQPPTKEYLMGEILSNLYVGLGRFHRGEKLTAVRFIQVQAVDRILELAPFIEKPQIDNADPFNNTRRFEKRFPQTAAELPDFLLGYNDIAQSAKAILDFLERHVRVNEGMKKAILALIDQKPDFLN